MEHTVRKPERKIKAKYLISDARHKESYEFPKKKAFTAAYSFIIILFHSINAKSALSTIPPLSPFSSSRDIFFSK
jgi:hypothetical protein